MNREQFRTAVFERDHHTCVVPGCGYPAQDAHHIIERALWIHDFEKEGYILDNGASLCALHHIHAERNFITPDSLRQWCGIKTVIRPYQMPSNIPYNKWGESIPSPTRTTIKYPHTPYLPCSPSVNQDDVRDCGHANIEKFVDMPLIITTKMDGSNCLLTNEKVCARNAYSANHKSFDLLKARHAEIKDKIPPNIQIFGEWLYAKHSIHYCGANSNRLEDLLQIFAVYDRDTGMWESWDNVAIWAKNIGAITVPVVGEFTYSNTYELQGKLTTIGNNIINQHQEGIVIRNKYPFYWGTFKDNVAKYVRSNHVQTDQHWSQQPIVKNEEQTRMNSAWSFIASSPPGTRMERNRSWL